jgi:hypothetical protein
MVAFTEYTPAASVVAPTMVGFCKVELNELGPLQLKVAPTVEVEVKLKVCPEHKGELAPIVNTVGVWFTTTFTVFAALAQPEIVAVTEYTPAASVVAPTIVGFCAVEVNELGPLQLKVAPTVEVEVKLKVWPEHKGELAPIVNTVGVWLTTTLIVRVALAQPEIVEVTE